MLESVIRHGARVASAAATPSRPCLPSQASRHHLLYLRAQVLPQVMPHPTLYTAALQARVLSLIDTLMKADRLYDRPSFLDWLVGKLTELLDANSSDGKASPPLASLAANILYMRFTACGDGERLRSTDLLQVGVGSVSNLRQLMTTKAN